MKSIGITKQEAIMMPTIGIWFSKIIALLTYQQLKASVPLADNVVTVLSKSGLVKLSTRTTTRTIYIEELPCANAAKMP